jgi:hypothetical protein
MAQRRPMGLLLSSPSLILAMKRLTCAPLPVRKFTSLTFLYVAFSLVLHLIQSVNKEKISPLCFWRLLTLLAQVSAIF